MKLFFCTNHAGFWPVGVASIVLAENKNHARKLLDEVLEKRGLATSKEKPYDLEEITHKEPFALILNDGEY